MPGCLEVIYGCMFAIFSVGTGFGPFLMGASFDRMQSYISAKGDPEKSWKVFYLYAMGEKPEANRARCPRTSALLDGIPGLFQAFFSILDGGKSVPAHRGPYRGYIRYHLGLLVPEHNPPSIRIKDQHYTWQEGKSVLFDDSWEHEVSNHSDGDRVVLIVDIRRPMPLPFDAVNRLAQRIMKPVYGRHILKRLAAMTPPRSPEGAAAASRPEGGRAVTGGSLRRVGSGGGP